MTERLALPGYRAAITDLLGLLALGQLSGFTRLAADAEMAPTVVLQARMAQLAVTEFGHYRRLEAALVALGADPEEAMAPFRGTFERFHERSRPSTWLEGVIKAYVGDAIATDFYREVAGYVDPQTRALIEETLADEGRSDFLVQVAREAMAAEPAVSGRLALWARRLVGEALTQAQMVAVERDSLAELLAGTFGGPGADLAELGRMFQRLTDAHVARMARLGLAA